MGGFLTRSAQGFALGGFITARTVARARPILVHKVAGLFVIGPFYSLEQPVENVLGQPQRPLSAVIAAFHLAVTNVAQRLQVNQIIAGQPWLGVPNVVDHLGTATAQHAAVAMQLEHLGLDAVPQTTGQVFWIRRKA